MNAPKVEKHIGQYKIVRTLGAGGMGTVYLGEHVLLGKRAAIKTLLASLSSHREIVDRFFNEARAISAISDPGVVQIFDFGYHVDGTAYIVMEFLEGESLSARLDRQRKLHLLDALRLARQLSSSLAAAHERGIVHRDLKPGNVFVIRDPEVPGGERTKILDFGICKLGDPDCTTTTQTGTMLGTPVYMSPEQCRGAGRVDHRSDIYSLGCVLFHMIAGRPPFDCESTGDYIAAHLREPAPPPSEFAPELPPGIASPGSAGARSNANALRSEIDALTKKCLAKEPEDRFASMTELQHAIEQVLAQLSDSGRTLPAPPVHLRTTPLGEGFRSSYDVNRGNNLRTVDQTPAPPSHPWFVDSLLPISISSHYDSAHPRMGWGKRLALVLALFVGVAAGLLGTNAALDREARAQTPPPESPSIGSREEVQPAVVQTMHEATPPEPIAQDDEPAEPDEIAPAKRAAKTQAARAQRPTITKPVRPRRVVRPKPTPQAQPEDLYDTR